MNLTHGVRRKGAEKNWDETKYWKNGRIQLFGQSKLEKIQDVPGKQYTGNTKMTFDHQKIFLITNIYRQKSENNFI